MQIGRLHDMLFGICATRSIKEMDSADSRITLEMVER